MNTVTKCKNCQFETQDHQCFVNRIEKMRTIPGVKVENIDGHYQIVGKICDWSIPRYLNLDEKQLAEYAAQMREGRKLQIPFIVETSKETSLGDISITVRSLQRQQLSPALIHILDYNNQRDKIYAMRDKIPLSVQTIILDDFPERYIYLRSNTFNSIYYGVVQAGINLPSDFIRRLDEKYNDDINHFVYLEDKGVSIRSTLLSKELGADYIVNPDGYLYKDKVGAWCKRNQVEQLVVKQQ